MTYTDWRDELKSNLLSVSEAERKRVLDYYAEAYADRREAGFSEREIIAEFGAPYDAAQRILNENIDEESKRESKETPPRKERHNIYGQPAQFADPAPAPAPTPQSASPEPAVKKKRKNRAGVIIISIISAILLLGLILFIILRAISCAIDPSFTDAHYAQQSESIQNVRIDASIGEVETVFYEGDKIEIEYHTSNIYDVDISEQNDTLVYRLRNKRWFMHWGTINFPKTTIKLPEGCVYNLDIDLSAGSTTVNGGTFGDIKIDLSAGTVNLLGNTVCKSLKIDLSAGKVSIHKVKSANAVEIDLSAGQVDIDEAECSRLNIDLSAGTVDIDRLNCPKINIDLSAGTVKLDVVGQQSEYTIAVDKSAGSCNVGNQKGTDDNKKIDIDLSAGSVTVKFIDSK